MFLIDYRFVKNIDKSSMSDIFNILNQLSSRANHITLDNMKNIMAAIDKIQLLVG